MATDQPILVVDHPENAHRLDEAMRARRLWLDVLIDIDVGLGRTGVLPESTLELTGHITNSGNLQLKGIQAYAGFAMPVSYSIFGHTRSAKRPRWNACR